MVLEHEIGGQTLRSSPSLDIFLASCYTACFLSGVPANIMALRYFMSELATNPNIIFRVTIITDIILGFLSLPVIFSIGTRKAMMFGNATICGIWGAVFRGTAFFSIFLVAVMSIYRSIVLVFPLKQVNRRSIIICISLYFLFLVVHQVAPVALKLVKFQFDDYDCYCWDYGANSTIASGVSVDTIDNIVDCSLIIFPFIPISFSCILNIVMLQKQQKKNRGNRSKMRTTRATTTIIIFTLVYMVCNLPVVVVYMLWTVTLIKNTYPYPYFNNQFMMFYSWNIADVMTVCANSAINPVIYFTRNYSFRKKVLSKFMKNSDIVENKTVTQWYGMNKMS